MCKQANKLITALLIAVLFFVSNFTVVYADELKVGSVKGLPEKLVVLDDNGRSVSENGEYFFQVEDMQVAEVYTKKIQIMNLREDATYKITFKAQPVSKTGDIDLEKECDCEIYLDHHLIYYGAVTGKGEPDIRDNAVSLGTYKPGESHVMQVNVVWRGTEEGGLIDEGARIVDKDGTSVIREPEGSRHIEGAVEFKWIFYAEVRDDDDVEVVSEVSRPDYPDVSDVPEDSGIDISVPGPPTPDESKVGPTPGIPDVIKTGETIAFVAIGVVMMATLLMAVLFFGKKKKKKKKTVSGSEEKTE